MSTEITAIQKLGVKGKIACVCVGDRSTQDQVKRVELTNGWHVYPPYGSQLKARQVDEKDKNQGVLVPLFAANTTAIKVPTARLKNTAFVCDPTRLSQEGTMHVTEATFDWVLMNQW